MTLPHLIWVELLSRLIPSGPTFETREQEQHTSNTSSKTSTHHIIGTTRASSIMVIILRKIWMMKSHRIFEPGKIRKLLVKTT
jgi:hypothetical protein